MTFSCYETRDIITWVNLTDTVPTFFMDTFFNDVRFTTADKVVLGNYTNNVRMAPFSNICTPGKPVARVDNERSAIEAKAPMIHLSDTVVPCDSDDFRVGPQGEFIETYRDRMEAAVGREATDQRDAINKRVAWMCALLIMNGQYTIEGEDVKTTLMNFGRRASNTVDLTLGPAADLWSANTARVFDQLTAYSRLIKGNGQITVMMSPEAADAAHQHQDFADWIKPSWTRQPLPANVKDGPQQFEHATQWATNNAFDFWTVEETYIHPTTGLETRFIPAGGVVMARKQSFGGLRVYQGIKRPNGDTENGTIIPRDYIDEACDCRKIGSKSRPMPLARNVNASLFLQAL